MFLKLFGHHCALAGMTIGGRGPPFVLPANAGRSRHGLMCVRHKRKNRHEKVQKRGTVRRGGSALFRSHPLVRRVSMVAAAALRNFSHHLPVCCHIPSGNDRHVGFRRQRPARPAFIRRDDPHRNALKNRLALRPFRFVLPCLRPPRAFPTRQRLSVGPQALTRCDKDDSGPSLLRDAS